MITNSQSGTRVDEIASGIYRISTPVGEELIPGGFSFGQYLIVDDEPLLFHTGLRRMFPLVQEAVSKIIPVNRLRYVGFSHFEADESGSINDFLAAAPQAVAFSSQIGTMVSLNDIADRPPRGLADGEKFSTGRHHLQWIYTPHVPHGWDCGVLFDDTTKTLLCGDLFTQGGSDCPPLTTADILAPSETFRKPLDYFAHSSGSQKVLKRLAELRPRTLACMHGSAFEGEGSKLLRGLSDILEQEQALVRAAG